MVTTKVFNITTPSVTWQIDHNFGNKPVIDVCLDYNGTKLRAFPSNVVHTSDNRVTITWSSAQTGSAVVSGVKS
jgi:hypothetical protein